MPLPTDKDKFSVPLPTDKASVPELFANLLLNFRLDTSIKVSKKNFYYGRSREIIFQLSFRKCNSKVELTGDLR